MKRFGDLIKAAHEGAIPSLIMGILNVTPDSFSDGGRYFRSELAVSHAELMVGEGAGLIDCGAESTRPGYNPISAEEEWHRLEPVLASLVSKGIYLSVDTMKAEVAGKSLKAGAIMINDIWGLHRDPDMASVIADYDAYAVIMHNRDVSDPALDLKSDFRRFFDISLEKAHFAGIQREKIILDPGIGFGKNQEQNLEAIRNLSWLRQEYQLPVLLGLSRKSLFGHFLGLQKEERLFATIAANLYGAEEGVSIIRVHDVKAHKEALLFDYMLRSGL